MGWYFSVALPDDPAPCHDAAGTLRSVARAAQEAADLLDGHAVLPPEDFGGLAARSYRDASAVLGNDARGIADDTHALAAALEDHALRVAAVRRTLAGIRDDALAQGYAITPQERVESVPVAGTTVDLPFQRLEARAVGAHAELEAARRDWWEAVEELTSGPLAPPPVGPPVGTPVGPPVGPEGVPPQVDRPEPDPRGSAPPAGQGETHSPPDTPAPAPPTGPASSYETKPEAASPDAPTWHWAAIPLPAAPPALHGEPLREELSSPCPSTYEGVLT